MGLPLHQDSPLWAGLPLFRLALCGIASHLPTYLILLTTFAFLFFVGSGKHWDRDGSSCSRIDDDTGNGEYVAYKCSCSATWDWKDIYSVATSKATIRVFVNRPLIHVVGYKYNVTG